MAIKLPIKNTSLSKPTRSSHSGKPPSTQINPPVQLLIWREGHFQSNLYDYFRDYLRENTKPNSGPNHEVAWPKLGWFLLAPSICKRHNEKEKIRKGAFLRIFWVLKDKLKVEVEILSIYHLEAQTFLSHWTESLLFRCWLN